MANEPYVSAKLKVTATFLDTDNNNAVKAVFNDVISVSANFALNTIPTASLVVAVGNRVDAASGVQKATIHDAKKYLKARDKVIVTLDITAGTGDQSKLAPGRYVIFEGFYVGIGYQRSNNQANYVLNLVHWLDDLNNSSAINGNWFPGVPFDYAQQALYDAKTETLNAFGPAPGIGTKYVAVDKLTTDLWGAVLKPIFQDVCNLPGGAVAARELPQDSPNKRNDAALAALDKMPGNAPGYVKVPLAMKLNPLEGAANVQSSITSYFDKTLGESFVQNSIWAKLVGEYAADFLFAISPAVEWALPIPFCGGLRWKDGDPVIRATEYSYANFTANMSQLIESVNIYFPLSTQTNLPTPRGAPNRKISFYRPCAMYPPEKTQDLRGLKLFKEPPRWVDQSGASALNAGNSTAGATTTGDPSGGGTTLPPSTAAPEDAIRGVQSTMQNFAAHWYMSEVLQQRYGELSGPLRFDIAPGSIVKIETPIRDREHETKSTDNLYVSIMSVSYVINSERSIAGTSFSVAHTRTDEELQANDAYSTDLPPLYAQKWSGGPLAVAK